MKKLGTKIVYELYPMSFCDSNNDGYGDIKGIISKLDYLHLLGIDYIWITPIFKSPKNDNGYDISNYFEIDESFGTMSDVEELIQEAKNRNIGIMFDMVFNHVSTDSEWFKKALEGDKEYQNYFYILKSKNKKEVPNNWESKFGGSAWEYKKEFDGFYLHLFDKTQADIKWKNEKVRNELFNVVNFWIDKGIKGFRFDVINLIGKPNKFISSDDFGKKQYTDKKDVHNYLKELNKNTFGKHNDIITVGEMSSTTINNCIKYTNPKEKELDMVFNFHHLKVDYKNMNKWENQPWDMEEFKNILKTWQIKMQNKGWNAVFFNNHDQPRVNSRYGNTDKYWFESSTLFASLMFSLKGTPFIYQGEEIGMTNPGWDSINKYKDVESLNIYKKLIKENKKPEKIIDILKVKSRDNSRTPMQWSDKEYAGFSNVKPWISIADNYKTINVENQINDPNSVFNFYRNLIQLKKTNKILSEGKISFDDTQKEIFVINRSIKNKKIKCIFNLSGKKIENQYIDLKIKKILSNNYDKFDKFIRPFQAIIVEL